VAYPASRRLGAPAYSVMTMTLLMSATLCSNTGPVAWLFRQRRYLFVPNGHETPRESGASDTHFCNIGR
jgi:hypothetical protein